MENKYLSEFDFSCYLSGVGNKAKDGGNEAIGKYLEYQKKGETFTMYFELANEEGDLITHDKGCRIVLPNTEINGREYDPYNRARKLTRKYKVQVIAVDKEKVEVTVSHNEVRKADNVRVVSLLNKSLEKDEHCVVPAKVIVVYNNVVILDIGGLGIPGYMPIKEWSMAYTNDLRVVTQKNEIVYVAVMSRGEMNENSQRDIKAV